MIKTEIKIINYINLDKEGDTLLVKDYEIVSNN